jgi:CheY-like chemotaxis protein
MRIGPVRTTPSNARMREALRRVALVYLIFGVVFVGSTEVVMATTDNDVRIATHLLFVVLSSVLLIVLVRRELVRRQDLEDRLMQAQRTESLARVAGGVAHDFNNLLTVILGYTDLVIDDLGPEHSSTPDLQAVRRSGEQALLQVDQLLTLSRQSVAVARTEAEVEIELDARGGDEQVLLVEDDATVRGFAKRVLQEHGYSADEVANGLEAVSLLRAGKRPDLVVTDVSMPAMGGVELAEQMRDLAPGTPVLFVSGYAEDPRLHEMAREVPFLPKPFSPPDLLRAVRHAIDGPVGQGSKR